MNNWTLMLARLIMAACLLPTGIAHLSNVSGLALSFRMQGLPYPNAVATACVVAETFGPLALVLGLAPRFTASVMVGTLLIVTGTLHRFWELIGVARQSEQALFVGNLATVAGLMFYLVSGPGDWSWQAIWKRLSTPGQAPKRR